MKAPAISCRIPSLSISAAPSAKYLGADHIRHVGIEYQEFGDERHRASKEAAFAAIPELVTELSSRVPDYARAEPARAS